MMLPMPEKLYRNFFFFENVNPHDQQVFSPIFLVTGNLRLNIIGNPVFLHLQILLPILLPPKERSRYPSSITVVSRNLSSPT